MRANCEKCDYTVISCGHKDNLYSTIAADGGFIDGGDAFCPDCGAPLTIHFPKEDQTC